MLRWLKRETTLLITVYQRWERDDGPLMASAVAYYVGLSFFPMILMLVAIIGLFFKFTNSGQDAQHAILVMVQNNLSDTARIQVKQALEQVRDTSTFHGPVALGMMLVSAIAAFVQLQRAFDRIGNSPPPEKRGIIASTRMVLVERWVAFLMLGGMGLLIIAVFVAGLVLDTMKHYSEKVLPGSRLFWGPVPLLVSFSANAALFTLIYHWLPKQPVPLRRAFRGGVAAAVVWEIGRQILAAFLIGTKYTDAYGVVGSFIGVMLWCYYAVAVLLLGAEYIQARWETEDASRRRSPGPSTDTQQKGTEPGSEGGARSQRIPCARMQ